MRNDQFIELLKQAGIEPPAAGYSPEWLWEIADELTSKSQFGPLPAAEVEVLCAIISGSISIVTSSIYEEFKEPLGMEEDS